jgi:hypothetical protein
MYVMARNLRLGDGMESDVKAFDAMPIASFMKNGIDLFFPYKRSKT